MKTNAQKQAAYDAMVAGLDPEIQANYVLDDSHFTGTTENVAISADGAWDTGHFDMKPLPQLMVDSVVLTCAASMRPQPVSWLWQYWLAMGKLHILAGAPGQGKTTIALAMMATVTIGGYGMSEPRIAAGTEIENLPSSGNGGGQQILHSRVNLALHPQGFTWKEGAVLADSPSIAELANPLNWDRVIERRAVALAFLQHKL